MPVASPTGGFSGTGDGQGHVTGMMSSDASNIGGVSATTTAMETSTGTDSPATDEGEDRDGHVTSMMSSDASNIGGVSATATATETSTGRDSPATNEAEDHDVTSSAPNANAAGPITATAATAHSTTTVTATITSSPTQQVPGLGTTTSTTGGGNQALVDLVKENTPEQQAPLSVNGVPVTPNNQ